MSDTLTTALEATNEPRERRPFTELVARQLPALVKSLQDEKAADILTRHYMNAIRTNPLLQECTTESLLAALMLSAQVRLEPGPLGHVYLVPFKGECVWVLGYTGILELARRSERVAALRSTVVWDCDAYDPPHLDERGVHYSYRPGPEDDRTERVGVLVTWTERAGSTKLAQAYDVPRSRVERARKASPAARKGTGPWTTDETAMWAKTGVRYVRPWLPLSPDAGYAFSHDEAVLSGVDTDATGAAYPVVVEGQTVEDEVIAAAGHSVRVDDE